MDANATFLLSNSFCVVFFICFSSSFFNHSHVIVLHVTSLFIAHDPPSHYPILELIHFPPFISTLGLRAMLEKNHTLLKVGGPIDTRYLGSAEPSTLCTISLSFLTQLSLQSRKWSQLNILTFLYGFPISSFPPFSPITVRKPPSCMGDWSPHFISVPLSFYPLPPPKYLFMASLLSMFKHVYISTNLIRENSPISPSTFLLS